MFIVVFGQNRYNTSMLWIIGKTFHELENYLADRAIPFGLFADQSVSRHETQAATIVTVDFSSETAIRSSLKNGKYEVSGLLQAGYEPYVVPGAWLAAFFGVPGPSALAAKAATNKAVMRQMLRSARTRIAPDWKVVASRNDLDDFVARHGFPVMLKPTNLMKSLYVSKNTDTNALYRNYQTLRQALQEPRISSGPSQILVEEYMPGSMHTLAGFVDTYGRVQLAEAVADCITANEIGMDDTYIAERHLPSKLDARALESLHDIAEQGVKALHLRSSALHVEIMLTPTGPKIIEIAARIGGYRPRMYRYACGIDLYGALIATATNHTIDLTPQATRYSCAIEVFPSSEGRLAEVTNLHAVQQLDSVLHIRQQHHVGTIVGPAKAGYRACLVVVLGSDEPAKLQQDSAFIRDSMKIVTKPPAN